MKILEHAVRQYKHNTGDGFVFSYDKEETEKLVTVLLDQISKRQVFADYLAEELRKRVKK